MIPLIENLSQELQNKNGFIAIPDNDPTIVGERLNLDFISKKAYVAIPAAIYNHILTSPILADKEKQLYFLAHSLVEIKDKEEDRNEVGLCGKFWAKRLGCCIRTIFDMQKKLELHGYFKITRSKSSSNHNNRNVIQVTLPDQIKLSSKDLELYIPLNYQLLTEICSADLPDFAKILWLDSYRQSYAHCLKSSKSSESQLLASSGEFFCFTTFDELQKKYSCSKNKISKAFIRLEEKNFLKKHRLLQRHVDEEFARQDKSIYKILLSDFIPKPINDREVCKSSYFNTYDTIAKSESVEIISPNCVYNISKFAYSKVNTLKQLENFAQLKEKREAFAVEVKAPALSSSLSKLTDCLSVFTQKDLEFHLKSSLDANPNNYQEQLFEEPTAADLINQALSSKHLLSLTSKSDIDRKEVSLFTTPEIFQEEQELLNLANSVHVKKNIIRNLVPISEADNFLSLIFESDSFAEVSLKQKETLKHLLCEKGAIRLLQAIAGTGKSYVLGKLNEILNAISVNVIALAPTHKAKIELINVGFKNAHTVKGFLCNVRESLFLKKPSIIVVDEASMISSSDYFELLKIIKKTKSNIIFAGDERQLSSIDRGGFFEIMLDKFGSCNLDEVMRQKDTWGRELVSSLSKGMVESSIDCLTLANRLKWNINQAESLSKLISDWSQSCFGIKDRLIIAVKNLDVDMLNLAVRNSLKEGYVLQGPEVKIRLDDKVLSFMKNDRIIFKQTDKNLGIYNGDFATIIEVSSDNFVVELDSARRVSLDPNKVACAHGYAVTVCQSQGASIKDVYVLHTGFFGLRNLYVALSRHINNVHFYVDLETAKDKKTLIKQLSVDYFKGSSLKFILQQPPELDQEHGFRDVPQNASQNVPTHISTHVSPKDFESSFASKVDVVRDRLPFACEKIVNQILGKPELAFSDNTTLRYGSNGSLAIAISGSKAGMWYDFAKDQGGDMFDFVKMHLGKNFKQSVDYLQDALGLSKTFISYDIIEVEKNNQKNNQTSKLNFMSSLHSEDENYSQYLADLERFNEHFNAFVTAKQSRSKSDQQKVAHTQNLYIKSLYVEPGSVVDRYLRQVRKITCPIEIYDDIREIKLFNKELNKKLPTLIAFAKDSLGHITGGVRISLDEISAQKANVLVPKKSFGIVSGSFVEINRINNKSAFDTTIIAEGVETAMSIKSCGIKADILCALGVHNIKNYKATAGEKIIIAADNDGPNSKTAKVLLKAKDILEKQGAIVTILPAEAGDFNDLLIEQGLGAVAKAFEKVVL